MAIRIRAKQFHNFVNFLGRNDMRIVEPALPIDSIGMPTSFLSTYHAFVIMFLKIGISHGLDVVPPTISWSQIQRYIIHRPITTAYFAHIIPMHIAAMTPEGIEPSKLISIARAATANTMIMTRIIMLEAPRQLGKSISLTHCTAALAASVPAGKLHHASEERESSFMISIVSKDSTTTTQLIKLTNNALSMIPQPQWKMTVNSTAENKLGGFNLTGTRVDIHGSVNNSQRRGTQFDVCFIDEAAFVGSFGAGSDTIAEQGDNTLKQFISIYKPILQLEHRRLIMTCSAVPDDHSLIRHLIGSNDVTVKIFAFSCRRCIEMRIPSLCIHRLWRLGCDIPLLHHIRSARDCNQSSEAQLKSFTQEVVGVSCTTDNVLIPERAVTNICSTKVGLVADNCIGLIIALDPAHIQSQLGISIGYVVREPLRWSVVFVTCDQIAAVTEDGPRVDSVTSIIKKALDIVLPAKLPREFRSVEIIVERCGAVLDAEMYILGIEKMLQGCIQNYLCPKHPGVKINYAKIAVEIPGDVSGQTIKRFVYGVTTTNEITRIRHMWLLDAINHAQISICDKVATLNKNRDAMVTELETQLLKFARSKKKSSARNNTNDLLDALLMLITVFKIRWDPATQGQKFIESMI
jgi:hypothetical protein